MLDYSAKHRRVMIMTYQWPSFFADLAKHQQGRPVTLEQDGNLLLNNPPGEMAVLEGIDFQSGHRHDAIIFTMGGGPAAQTFRVEAPNLIWAVQDEHGSVVAVEILDGDERNVNVQFG